MLKKILSLVCLMILLTGCSLTKDLDNTPKKKVTNFLNNYQILDESVLSDLNATIDSDVSLSDEQKIKYSDIIKSNYQKMMYIIKDVKEDGDEATVTVEIEVINYASTLQVVKQYLNDNYDSFLTDGKFDDIKYNDYRLEELKKVDDTIKYTIDFTLTKVDNTWILDDIPTDTIDKINGIYEK